MQNVSPGAGRVVDLVRYPAGRYLVQDVKAELVAQFHEPRGMVVVRRANGVDVVGLHEDAVGLPALFGHGMAVGRELLVPADAGELDGHAVDLEHALLQLDLAEADAVLDALDDGLIAVRQAVEHIIQVRLLGRPELGGDNWRREGDRSGAVGADLAGLAHGGQFDLGAVEGPQLAGQNEMRPAGPATRTVDLSRASLYWASSSVTTVTSSTCRGGRATRYVSR